MSLDASPTPSAIVSIDGPNNNSVHFPPREVADFVIHYANTHFHVHKFILFFRSSYFRTYFQTLSPPSLGSCSTSSASQSILPSNAICPAPSATNNTSSYAKQQPCNHPSIAHCIHLPRQTTLVSKEAVDAEDFRLFLCHLYFSSHYCYPPFLPKTDINLEAYSHLLPVSLSFPALPLIDWSTKSPQLRLTTDGECKRWCYHEALLTLALYFDITAIMQQSEAVMLTMLQHGERTDSQWLARQCVSWVLPAELYKLQKWKKACIKCIAAEAKHVLQSDEYKISKQQWDKALVLEVLEAAVRSK